MKYAFSMLVAAFLCSLPSHAVGQASADILGCEQAALDSEEMEFIYGPFWDGGWRLTVDMGGPGEAPTMTVEDFEFLPADHVVEFTSHAQRSGHTTRLRQLRKKSLTMINEMQLTEDRPELRSQRRPFVVKVGMSDGTTRCAAGYANWPRLPGSYYFEAIEVLRDMVEQPGGPEGWTAVRVMLDQVKPARLQR